MEIAATVIQIALVVISVLLVVVVMLQKTKSSGMGAAFGGGSSSSVFGGRGATTFLSKATGILAGVFFVLSIALAVINTNDSVTAGIKETAAESDSVP